MVEEWKEEASSKKPSQLKKPNQKKRKNSKNQKSDQDHEKKNKGGCLPFSEKETAGF